MDVRRLAAAEQPHQLWPRLQIARGEARLGRLDRSLTIFRGLAARFGARPEIALVKAGVLQEAGFHEEARRELDDALCADPHVFSLRCARVSSAIVAADLSAARAGLAELRPSGPKEASEVEMLRSRLAAAEFDFEAAAGLAESAAAGDPSEASRLEFAAQTALLAFRPDAAERLLKAHCERQASVSKLQGATSNPLQTHLGHLLAEWRLDRHALARTIAALESVGEVRIEALKGAVAEYPDYTPAALALFVELRRQGKLPTLADAARLGGPRRIPRTIVQFWEDEVLPWDVGQVAATWELNNPGDEHRIFSFRTGREYLERRHGKATLLAFLRAREPAQRADIFRLPPIYSRKAVITAKPTFAASRRSR